MKEGISGHKTGLPKKLLELFNARPPLEKKTDLKKPNPKVPHIGLAKYVAEFKEPDDPEYEPGPPKTRPSSPRRYRNPEMRAQARIDEESKLEKYALLFHQEPFHAAHVIALRSGLMGQHHHTCFLCIPSENLRICYQGRKPADKTHLLCRMERVGKQQLREVRHCPLLGLLKFAWSFKAIKVHSGLCRPRQPLKMSSRTGILPRMPMLW